MSVLLTLATLLAGCTAGETPRGADTTGTRAATPATPSNRHPAKQIPTYQAFVAVEDANVLAVLSGPPWRVVRRLAVPAPHNLAASRDGRYVAVSSPAAGVVTIVQVRQARIVARARVPGSPHDLAFTVDGSRLWVTAERGRRLVAVAVPGGRTVATLALAGRRTTWPSRLPATTCG